jgi:hypothetical protein
MIANPLVISDPFVPLVLPASSSKEPAFASLSLKVSPQAPATPVFEPLIAVSADQSRSSDVCSQPTVTLERKGDEVSGIRIQCGCGKVIELSCLY